MLANRLLTRVPKLCGQIVRQAHDHGGHPGKNLPFYIDNKVTFTLGFTFFFGSGIAVPYIMVRHHLTK